MDNCSLWYAVQKDPSDEWGNGSCNFEEACKMLFSDDEYNLIAVIEDSRDPVCIREIWKNEIKNCEVV